jgi:hypothetical protein
MAKRPSVTDTGKDAPMIVNMTDGVIVSIIDGPEYADGFIADPH